MSEYIHKHHNVTVLLYHLVFPAKYRRALFDEQVDAVLQEVCLEIEKRYEVKFIEIGVDVGPSPLRSPQPLDWLKLGRLGGRSKYVFCYMGLLFHGYRSLSLLRLSQCLFNTQLSGQAFFMINHILIKIHSDNMR